MHSNKNGLNHKFEAKIQWQGQKLQIRINSGGEINST